MAIWDKLKFPTQDFKAVGSWAFSILKSPIKDIATIGRALPKATPFQAAKKISYEVPKRTGSFFLDKLKVPVETAYKKTADYFKPTEDVRFRDVARELPSVFGKTVKLGVNITQEFARYSGGGVGMSLYNLFADIKDPSGKSRITSYQPTKDDPKIEQAIKQFIFGKEAVKPAEQLTVDLGDWIKEAGEKGMWEAGKERKGAPAFENIARQQIFKTLEKHPYATSMIAVPAMIALDFTGFGGTGKQAAKNAFKYFSKADNLIDVSKPMIKMGIPEDIVKVAAPKIVKMKNPLEIEKAFDKIELLQKSTNISPAKPSAKALETMRRPKVEPTPLKPITKVEPLITEARKYKSAEEFVAAHPKVYHGTAKKFDVFSDEYIGKNQQSDFGEGFYFTNKKHIAKSFAKDADGDIVMDVKLELKNPAKNKDLLDTEIQGAIDDEMGFKDVGEVLRKKGFDGIEFTHTDGSIEYVVFNADQIKTKSQLTDIYNKAKIPIKKEIKLLTTPDIAGEGFVMKGLPKRKGLLPITKAKRELETAKKARIEKKVTDQLLKRLDKTNTRKGQIRVVRDYFNLTDAEIKSISRKDVGLMSDFEFKKFIDDVRIKAEKLGKKKQSMNELVQQMKDKELDVENLRKSMKLPTMKNMTITDIKKLDEAIKPFQKGDEFLSVRKLEVVDRTELKGIKTWREAREKLAKKLDVPVEKLQNIKVSEFDRFRYDTALAERNPFYKMMVEESAGKTLVSEAEYLKLEQEVLNLAKDLKPKGITGKIIPQQKNIRAFMEAKPADRSKISLTETEDKLVRLMTKEFEDVRDYLIKMEAMKAGKDNYFTHIRRGVLEAVKEDGVIKAVKEIFEQYKMEEQAFNILDKKTGEILAMDKFFKFAMHRTGEIKPTENTVKAFLTYMRTFKKKQALDEIVPLVDIYAQALTPKGMTKEGVLLHGNLQTFVKEWLNTKKGRHITLMAKQNGKIDGALRTIKTFTSLRDLGLNLPVSIASEVGEQVTTYQLLGKGRFALGKVRQNTKQGKEIIEKYRNLIGKNPWRELIEPSKEAGDRLMEGIFILFRDASTRANKTFLLGSLNKQEFKTGVITPERLSALRTELGRYRMVEGMKSIIGATPEGKGYTQYKTWAIPIIRTNIKNLETIGKKIARQSKGSSEWKKSILELYREAEITAFAMLAFSLVRDEDDDSFIGQIMNKAYRESTTLIQALQPKMFLTAGRTASFITELGENLTSILLLEKYEEKEGLKGVERFKKQLTPVAVSQVFKKKKTEYEKAKETQEKKEEDLKESMKSKYEEIQKLKEEDYLEASKMYRGLSAEEKKAYNSIKRSEETKNLSGREEDIYPVYLKITEMKKTDYLKARKMYNELSKEDKKVYKKVKAKLE